MSRVFLFVVVCFAIGIILVKQGRPASANIQKDEMKSIGNLELSRNTCVQIVSQATDSKGSGFLIGDQLVATCFHVVAAIQADGKNVQFKIFDDLKVVMPDGEQVSASCLTTPTQADPAPILYDCAILKLSQKPAKAYATLKIIDNEKGIDLGADVVFSGYPLATPGVVTHRGMISG